MTVIKTEATVTAVVETEVVSQRQFLRKFTKIKGGEVMVYERGGKLVGKWTPIKSNS